MSIVRPLTAVRADVRVGVGIDPVEVVVEVGDKTRSQL